MKAWDVEKTSGYSKSAEWYFDFGGLFNKRNPFFSERGFLYGFFIYSSMMDVNNAIPMGSAICT